MSFSCKTLKQPRPMNLKVGRVTPCAPFAHLTRPGAHGVTRPTAVPQFRGSRREIFIRGILSMDPCAKAGASSTHSKRSACPDGLGSREAFGVRPAGRRFRFRGTRRECFRGNLSPRLRRGERKKTPSAEVFAKEVRILAIVVRKPQRDDPPSGKRMDYCPVGLSGTHQSSPGKRDAS